MLVLFLKIVLEPNTVPDIDYKVKQQLNESIIELK
jgi:hypothetical protein